MPKPRTPLLGIAALLLLILALYYPGAGGPFLRDDFPNILEAQHLEISEFLEMTANAVRAGQSNFGRPIARATFALNRHLAGGVHSFSFKLTNILIHLANTILVFLLSRYLLLRLGSAMPHTGGANQDPRRANVLAALAIAALWGLHPLHVSTVLYTVQRMTELSAFFVLAGVLFYVRGRQHLVEGRTALGAAEIAFGLVVCGLLGVLSKENAALLPVFLLLLEGALYRFKSITEGPRVIRFAAGLALLVPTLMIFGYLAAVALGFAEQAGERGFTPTERLLTQTRVLTLYLGQLLVPDISRMSIFHPAVDISQHLLDPPQTFLSVTFLLALILGALVALQRNRYVAVAFGVLWFFTGHLLESTVIPLEMVWEHRNYVPSYGLCFSAGYALTHARVVLSLRPILRFALLGAVLVGLANPLQLRVSYWSHISDLLVHELLSHPGAPAVWVSLAHAAVRNGQFEEGAKYYRRAAALDPSEAGHLIAVLTLTVHKLRRTPSPELMNTVTARLRDHPISAYCGVQLRLLVNGFGDPANRNPQALKAAAEVLEQAAGNHRWVNPRSRIGAYLRLVRVNLFRQEPMEAVGALRKVLELDPAQNYARLWLVKLLVSLQRNAAALTELEQLEQQEASPQIRRRTAALKRHIFGESPPTLQPPGPR